MSSVRRRASPGATKRGGDANPPPAAPRKKRAVQSTNIDGPTPAQSPEDAKKQKRLLRNRLSAQQHREKQKAYKDALEEYIRRVTAERNQLRDMVIQAHQSCGCGFVTKDMVARAHALCKAVPPDPPPAGRGSKAAASTPVSHHQGAATFASALATATATESHASMKKGQSSSITRVPGAGSPAISPGCDTPPTSSSHGLSVSPSSSSCDLPSSAVAPVNAKPSKQVVGKASNTSKAEGAKPSAAATAAKSGRPSSSGRSRVAAPRTAPSAAAGRRKARATNTSDRSGVSAAAVTSAHASASAAGGASSAPSSSSSGSSDSEDENDDEVLDGDADHPDYDAALDFDPCLARGHAPPRGQEWICPTLPHHGAYGMKPEPTLHSVSSAETASLSSAGTTKDSRALSSRAHGRGDVAARVASASAFASASAAGAAALARQHSIQVGADGDRDARLLHSVFPGMENQAVDSPLVTPAVPPLGGAVIASSGPPDLVPGLPSPGTEDPLAFFLDPLGLDPADEPGPAHLSAPTQVALPSPGGDASFGVAAAFAGPVARQQPLNARNKRHSSGRSLRQSQNDALATTAAAGIDEFLFDLESIDSLVGLAGSSDPAVAVAGDSLLDADIGLVGGASAVPPVDGVPSVAAHSFASHHFTTSSSADPRLAPGAVGGVPVSAPAVAPVPPLAGQSGVGATTGSHSPRSAASGDASDSAASTSASGGRRRGIGSAIVFGFALMFVLLPGGPLFSAPTTLPAPSSRLEVSSGPFGFSWAPSAYAPNVPALPSTPSHSVVRSGGRMLASVPDLDDVDLRRFAALPPDSGQNGGHSAALGNAGTNRLPPRSVAPLPSSLDLPSVAASVSKAIALLSPPAVPRGLEARRRGAVDSAPPGMPPLLGAPDAQQALASASVFSSRETGNTQGGNTARLSSSVVHGKSSSQSKLRGSPVTPSHNALVQAGAMFGHHVARSSGARPGQPIPHLPVLKDSALSTLSDLPGYAEFSRALQTYANAALLSFAAELNGSTGFSPFNATRDGPVGGSSSSSSADSEPSVHSGPGTGPANASYLVCNDGVGFLSEALRRWPGPPFMPSRPSTGDRTEARNGDKMASGFAASSTTSRNTPAPAPVPMPASDSDVDAGIDAEIDLDASESLPEPAGVVQASPNADFGAAVPAERPSPAIDPNVGLPSPSDFVPSVMKFGNAHHPSPGSASAALVQGNLPYMMLLTPASTLAGMDDVASEWAPPGASDNYGVPGGDQDAGLGHRGWVEIGCQITSVRRVHSVEISV